jgi:hypothetical protein
VKKLLLILVLLNFLFSGCFKEDERIPARDRGEKVTETLAMTQSYKYQVYYSLEDSMATATVDKQSYDLIFENTEAGYRILLNTANFMMASASGKYSFEEVNSFAGLDMQFDPSYGNLGETAIGNWMTIDGADTLFPAEVYVINRGFDDVGNALGYRKIIFDSLKKDRYYFRYAMLNSNEFVSAVVSKSPGQNFSYYSFNTAEQVYPEPAKNSYDLLFTQYTTLLYTNIGEPYPYLVTGVLLNRFQTIAAQDSTKPFDEINLEDALSQTYSDTLDLIGYDWKDVVGDVSSGAVVYEVKSERTYFIRNQHEFYFKLRFISFYNNAGEKGYPTIEFQRL